MIKGAYTFMALHICNKTASHLAKYYQPDFWAPCSYHFFKLSLEATVSSVPKVILAQFTLDFCANTAQISAEVTQHFKVLPGCQVIFRVQCCSLLQDDYRQPPQSHIRAQRSKFAHRKKHKRCF